MDTGLADLRTLTHGQLVDLVEKYRTATERANEFLDRIYKARVVVQGMAGVTELIDGSDDELDIREGVGRAMAWGGTRVLGFLDEIEELAALQGPGWVERHGGKGGDLVEKRRADRLKAEERQRLAAEASFQAIDQLQRGAAGRPSAEALAARR